MENENALEKIVTPLERTASVRNVYGEPIVTENKTIIPVARIAFGFGGGYGKKNKNNNQPVTDSNPLMENGAGGGGGMYAMPKGVYEITPYSTRFIPVNNTRQLVLGMVIGFLIRGLMLRRRKG
jgi:uncharacterized spore protein YtfJ